MNDELFYPESNVKPSAEQQNEIFRLFQDWNLSHIVDYVDSNLFLSPKYAWQDILSPGELQRLSFIRLLIRLSSVEERNLPRITLVFLDEITSSLDPDMENKMYQHLIRLNLTVMSIGHRESLRQYHQLELILYENGRYNLLNI